MLSNRALFGIVGSVLLVAGATCEVVVTNYPVLEDRVSAAKNVITHMMPRLPDSFTRKSNSLKALSLRN